MSVFSIDTAPPFRVLPLFLVNGFWDRTLLALGPSEIRSLLYSAGSGESRALISCLALASQQSALRPQLVTQPFLIKLYQPRALICFSKREISPRRARRTQSKIRLLGYPAASRGVIQQSVTPVLLRDFAWTTYDQLDEVPQGRCQ